MDNEAISDMQNDNLAGEEAREDDKLEHSLEEEPTKPKEDMLGFEGTLEALDNLTKLNNMNKIDDPLGLDEITSEKAVCYICGEVDHKGALQFKVGEEGGEYFHENCQSEVEAKQEPLL